MYRHITNLLLHPISHGLVHLLVTLQNAVKGLEEFTNGTLGELHPLPQPLLQLLFVPCGQQGQKRCCFIAFIWGRKEQMQESARQTLTHLHRH